MWVRSPGQFAANVIFRAADQLTSRSLLFPSEEQRQSVVSESLKRAPRPLAESISSIVSTAHKQVLSAYAGQHRPSLSTPRERVLAQPVANQIGSPVADGSCLLVFRLPRRPPGARPRNSILAPIIFLHTHARTRSFYSPPYARLLTRTCTLGALLPSCSLSRPSLSTGSN